MKMIYFCNCVNWPREDVRAEGGLRDMISSGRNITRKTFLRHVDRASRLEVETALGYPMGKLTAAKDFAIQYKRGKLHGRRVYFLDHSAIEYVFTPDGGLWPAHSAASRQMFSDAARKAFQ